MPLNYFQRLCCWFDRFDSMKAENQKLRGLSRREAIACVERKRRELLGSYINGAISAYQCRIFLSDYIRNSLCLADEIATIESHQTDIESATFERLVPTESNEIEHSMIALLKGVRKETISMPTARTEFERLIRLLPERSRQEWRNIFNQLCHDVTIE